MTVQVGDNEIAKVMIGDSALWERHKNWQDYPNVVDNIKIGHLLYCMKASTSMSVMGVISTESNHLNITPPIGYIFDKVDASTSWCGSFGGHPSGSSVLIDANLYVTNDGKQISLMRGNPPEITGSTNLVIGIGGPINIELKKLEV